MGKSKMATIRVDYAAIGDQTLTTVAFETYEFDDCDLESVLGDSSAVPQKEGFVVVNMVDCREEGF